MRVSLNGKEVKLQVDGEPVEVSGELLGDLPALWYDYTNQAWVRDGRYIACSHPAFACDCYGTQHEGEKADPTLCLQR